MNARELVRRVEDLGIELTLSGDRIRYRTKNGPPPPELLAGMKQHRAALVTMLRRREALHWPPLRNDSEVDRRGPLSWTQRKVWATTFFINDGTYNLSGTLRLVGPLEFAAFESALEDVHRRHPSLRTVFPIEDGAPVQRILPNGAPVVVVNDLTNHTSNEVIDECLRRCEAIVAQPLALDQIPPVRTYLYRLAEDDHVFFVVLHHVIADGVSLRLLLDDLACCYNARLAGKILEPPAHEPDMIDYARFEEEYVQYADLSAIRHFWRNTLRDAEFRSLPLPPATVPLNGTASGGALAVTVDAITTSGVRQLAAATRSTPFMVVSAAISSMLSRYTGRDDIIVGLPLTRRNRPGLDKLVGLLLDMVPVSFDVGGNPTFLELIQRTRTAILGVLGHAAVPIELALDDYSARQSGDQLFNVVLTDNGFRLEDPQFRGLDAYPLEVAQVGAKFDLNFLIRDDENTLHLDVEFDRRRLGEDDVCAMVSLVQKILAQGAASATSQVLDLPVMPAVATVATPDITQSINESESIFSHLAAMAETRGDATAISYEGAALGYRAFYRRAEQIARGLHRQGHKQGDVIAVALPRGIDLVTAMVGIMGAGAACLVLDDAWPAARVEQVRRDANVSRIIAQESDQGEGRVTIQELLELGSTAGPVAPVPASFIAYVIYTSGSTGQPKGIQVPHRNVLSLLNGVRAKFGFNASDTWTLFHSCSFDFSIWEIFGCLLTGGRLVVVARMITAEAAAFLQLLRREQVTVLNLTPSVLAALMTFVARDPDAVASLRYLIFGGEKLQPQLVEHWYRIVGDKTQLVNMYGITETTVHASWWWLKDGAQQIESNIGEALPGTSLHVLFDNGRPVDDRCVGEIYVGGAGVAAGYLGQPRETALRFVPDPFASAPGSRLYRSGDLGRRNGSTISYLGRCDSQVQVNGFRVELGEIEAALIGQPGVAAAAAATSSDDSGAFIVAAVVASPGAILSPADLLRGVRSILPRHMVPNSLVVIPELPLTVNGKLDRTAVVAAATRAKPISTAAQPPAYPDSAEGLLLELFREVLHDPAISTTSDFFDCGGDSMRAIRLVSLAADRGLVLGVRDVYASPGLKDLAARAVFGDANAVAPPEQPAFELLPVDVASSFGADVEDAYPVTALQFGMIYLKELAPESRVYHIVLSYRIAGRMDPDSFRSAAQIITDRHPILRTSFDLGHVSGPLQLVHSRVEAPVDFADLRHLARAEQLTRIAQIVEQERATDFDLWRPALFRLVVLTLSDADYQLIFTHHHAILDGWSVNIFFEDLHIQYTRNLSGEAAAVLPRMPNLFARYVGIEQRAMHDPLQLAFWQTRMAPGLGLLVPGRSSAPVMRQVRPELRPGLFAELRALATDLGVPVKALLLAAHLRVIAWLTGRDELVTGSVINCRPTTRDSDRALGLFLNEYPIRIRLQQQTWAELARAVHEDEQAMMPYRWYPHALIQQHHGTTPIFDNYFNFTEFHPTRQLVSHAGLDVLDVNEIESTHYALGVNYTIDVRTGELRLVLEYDELALARATVAAAAEAHHQALLAILADPHGPCLDSPVASVFNLGGPPELDHSRAATPAVASDPVAASAEGRKPRTALEHSVQRVWSEVLETSDFDVNTNFFNAGGTSLKAMRVVSRLRALHGNLSMETFMNAPTIAELAQALSANEPGATSSPSSLYLSGRNHSAGDGPQQYPLTRAQEHLWQISNQLPELPLFGMPGALRAEGPLDLEVLKRTFALLLERHAALRTWFLRTETGPVQVVERYAEIDLKQIDLQASADPAAQCEQIMLHGMLEPMDLTRAPLLRTILFRLADDLHVIYLNIHHIICDGESMALLMSEAARIYRDLSTGASLESWRVLPFGSGDVARAENDWIKSPQAEAQRRFWVERLAPPWPSLASGDNRFGERKPVDIIERLRSANCRRLLSPAIAESVSAAARRHSLTEFMVVLTAFASTLRQWSNRDDIRIATMTANRVDTERESVVGLLANTVILRLDVKESRDLFDLSAQARRVCIEAYERQELPFADVWASLQSHYLPEDRAGQIFEVMLLMPEETQEVIFGEHLRLMSYKPQRGALRPLVIPTTCDLVLAVTTAGPGLVLNLQYTPAVTGVKDAEALLDDIAAELVNTARILNEHT